MRKNFGEKMQILQKWDKMDWLLLSY